MKFLSKKYTLFTCTLALAAPSLLLVPATAGADQSTTSTDAVESTNSTSPGTTEDSDGDGLLDTWETEGYDANDDGTVDIDLPGMGANPQKKDIFVEMDYMPGLLASDEELDRITDIFASYPVSNPDGSQGINIHLDAGEESANHNLGGGNRIPTSPLSGLENVTALRQSNSDPNRNGIFHYMVWGDYYGADGSSGIAELNGTNFLVTVGPTYWGEASSDIRVGTFVHEIGHNLGLEHGGDTYTNYKPNYLSIMNYRYQFGILREDGSRWLGYSTHTTDSLNENSLNESQGLGESAAGYYYTWYDYATGTEKTAPADGPIDFNGNGEIDQEPVSADINWDGYYDDLTGPNDMDLLTFQAHRPSSSTESGPAPAVERNELTADDARMRNLIP